MTSSDGKGGEISRRALLQAATAVLAVAPVIACADAEWNASSDEKNAEKDAADASARSQESCVTTDKTAAKDDTTEARDTKVTADDATKTDQLDIAARPESRRSLFYVAETTSGKVMG